METRRMLNIRKRYFKVLGIIRRKEGLENLTPARYIESKIDRENQPITYVTINGWNRY